MNIIDEVNPTIEQVRNWGFDEDLYFISQDEDLILHNSTYTSVLIELASNADCPKQQYCESILEYFIQLQFLGRARNELKAIKDSIEASDEFFKTEWLKDFRRKFEYLYKIFMTPVKLTFDQCEKIAYDLNVGSRSLRKLTFTKTLENGALEFKARYGNYWQFFYINPETGNWKRSIFDPLKSFS